MNRRQQAELRREFEALAYLYRREASQSDCYDPEYRLYWWLEILWSRPVRQERHRNPARPS